MFNQGALYIALVGRNTIQILGGALRVPAVLEIPTDIIKDFEVLNRDGLYTLIKQWAKEHAVTEGQLFFVLSEFAYFDKLVTQTTDSDEEAEVLKFFDSVPFETLWTKVFDETKTTGVERKGKRAVAVNKSFFDAIRHAFSLQGFTIRGIVPAFALGNEGKKTRIDAAFVEYVSRHLDGAGKYNLVDSTEAGVREEKAVNEGSQKKTSNMPLLLGVFGVLILILVLMVALGVGQ